jgi:large subunit ribosomal protein L18
MGKLNRQNARKKRHIRVRSKVVGSEERPRLCVFRSISHIYVQVIDDSKGTTLAAASSKDVSLNDKSKKKTETADMVGSIIAQRAKSQGINKVVFDRGGYKYHGRIKALADAARKAGLEF